MGRRKKEDRPVIKGASSVFISKCFKDGLPAAIQPMFGAEYIIDGVLYAFTEEVLNEMLSTGKVKVTHRDSNRVNIIGLSEV